MNEYAIQARELTKVYRLYSGPGSKFLDMFGLLRKSQGAYTEHAALAGVSLDIKRGEKVAFIGRNGAGKSTLLKLITGVIEPTTGSLVVSGKAHALLQIGTGFHPDFTGRENVYAYLAQLGVTGREADRRYQEIVEFSELEEYIGQPVKTYSSGMAVRLMFSTSTAITPDLLVLDEILGVGDAYFAKKSYDRMKAMCDRGESTLLLVTHDIYSAATLCSRMIWIDAGRVILDSDATVVIKAYEDSVRAQEERRLTLRAQTRWATSTSPAPAIAPLLVDIRSIHNRPQLGPVYFSGITLLRNGAPVADLRMDSVSFDDAGAAHLVKDSGRWGELEVWNGRAARPMLNFGGPFHKVTVAFVVPRLALNSGGDLAVRVDYWADHQPSLEVIGHLNNTSRSLGFITGSPQRWNSEVFSWDNAAASPSLQIEPTGDQGAGDIVITAVRLLNSAGLPGHTIAHGETATFELAYRIVRRPLRERAQVFLVISRNHTERICKFMTSQLTFDERFPTGVIRMRWPKMMLSANTYSLAAEIAAEGYAERNSGAFFSVDPDVYHCLTHALEFSVTDSGWIGDHTVFEGEGEWELLGDRS